LISQYVKATVSLNDVHITHKALRWLQSGHIV